MTTVYRDENNKVGDYILTNLATNKVYDFNPVHSTRSRIYFDDVPAGKYKLELEIPETSTLNSITNFTQDAKVTIDAKNVATIVIPESNNALTYKTYFVEKAPVEYFTITYKADGGTFELTNSFEKDAAGNVILKKQKYEDVEQLGEFIGFQDDKLVRENYKFNNWRIEGTNHDINNAFGIRDYFETENNNVWEDIVLIPNWEYVGPSLNVTFSSEPAGVGTAIEAISVAKPEDSITLPTPAAVNGYKFLGWKLNGEGNLLSAGTSEKIEADTNFVGVWEKVAPVAGPVIIDAYKNDFNTKLAEATVRIFSNTRKLIAEAVTDENGRATFNLVEGDYMVRVVPKGWTTGQQIGVSGPTGSGLDRLVPGDEATESVQIYIVNIFDVTYESNLEIGAVLPEASEIAGGRKVTLKEPAPVEGYKFKGWTVKGSDQILDMATPVEINEDTTFVANWEKVLEAKVNVKIIEILADGSKKELTDKAFTAVATAEKQDEGFRPSGDKFAYVLPTSAMPEGYELSREFARPRPVVALGETVDAVYYIDRIATEQPTIEHAATKLVNGQTTVVFNVNNVRRPSTVTLYINGGYATQLNIDEDMNNSTVSLTPYRALKTGDKVIAKITRFGSEVAVSNELIVQAVETRVQVRFEIIDENGDLKITQKLTI